MGFEWPVNRDCYSEPLGDPPTPPDDEEGLPAYEVALAEYQRRAAAQSEAEDTAILVLWRLTGEQFGIQQVTVRPCPPSGWPQSPYVPLFADEGWGHSHCGCQSVMRCQHSGPSMIHLPGPVAPPTDDEPLVVTVAGVVMDPGEYVLEGDVLYRRNQKMWPTQNLARPLGEPGTWSVSYRQGRPVPAGGATMAGRLARQFMLACSGSDECELPSSLRQTTRRGASHSFDPTSILDAGLTGITAIDHWINGLNPNHLLRAPEVLL